MQTADWHLADDGQQTPPPPESEAGAPAKGRKRPAASKKDAAPAEAGARPPGAPEARAPKGEGKAPRAPKGATEQAPAAEARAEKPAKAEGGGGARQPKGERPQGQKGQPGQPQPKAKAPAPKPQTQVPPGYIPRLREKYQKEVVPALMKEFGYKNPMQVPAVSKVVLNIGLGEALENAKAPEAAQKDLATITGQQPVLTKAKKSIANFKVRKGQVVGVMVTLRSARMYEFLDRLINVAMPRIRDFRGAPLHGFDGRGNYSLGFREQSMFPEIDFNTVDKLRGMQITLTTTARTDDESRRLLTLLGVAFAKDRKEAAA